MAKRKHIDSQTTYAELREKYNERHSKAMSQQELAKLLHVSKSTVSRIENGETEPSQTVIKNYSKIFNIPVEQLMDLKDTKAAKDNAVLNTYGITADVADTLIMIKNNSCSSQDLSELVNAFMGNREQTLSLFMNIFFYLSADCNNRISDTGSSLPKNLLLTELANYIDNTVAPKVQSAMKKYNQMQELINENRENIYTEADYAMFETSPDEHEKVWNDFLKGEKNH